MDRDTFSVHPRERGEHTTTPCWPASGPGSSPRARGTPIPSPVRGSIPSVHPRERGEHWKPAFDAFAQAGSSPRARGTRAMPMRPRARFRFIPASAGNTPTKTRSNVRTSVHPRERGEHPPARHAASDTDGSSPRARGTPRLPDSPRVGVRFIPASAGNTSAAKPITTVEPVHPRERGEHQVRCNSRHDEPVHPRERGEHRANPKSGT